MLFNESFLDLNLDPFHKTEPQMDPDMKIQEQSLY